MYHIFNEISRFLSTPFFTLVNQLEHVPIAASFLLGLVGALAPCQLTGNLGAITYYGNRSLQKTSQWTEIFFFLLGKITIFSLLGMSVWILGQSFQESLPYAFAWFRKLMGPLFILIGLTLAGFIAMDWLDKITSRLPLWQGTGKLGSYLMGVSFSIAFCPTMFTLFFFTLMPIVLGTSYGAILPTIFAIGTSIPVLGFAFAISYLGLNGSLMKKGRKFGLAVQRTAGFVLILLGILDTITYL
ncbi:sulfite exporter TauE/SafE family protein [Bacillus sp. REN3]|uniref:urease accessory protein UreH domain-containing protein n=1 Tax=Bacillus sp. REN3 TaxID=2802440 RepID=UPI001AEEA4BF|nr:sulfite exporter TauE/SafE family protein [Bacillus sp. REN3]